MFKSSPKNNDSIKAKGNQQPFFQPKLTINQPGDKYEQEADAMAEQVVQRLEQGNGNREVNNPDSGRNSYGPFATGHSAHRTSNLTRKCIDCAREDELQREELPEEEKETLQAKPLMRVAADDGGRPASPKLASQLSSTKGGGHSLPPRTLSSMSQAFGADFSNVRVHTDSKAQEMSQGIQAKAFTHGSDIYFNKGQFNPQSKEGKRLLGHELTHVVQQGSIGGMLQREGGEEEQSRVVKVPSGVQSREEFLQYAEVLIYGKIVNKDWKGSKKGEAVLADITNNIGFRFRFIYNDSELHSNNALSSKDKREADKSYSTLSGEGLTAVNEEIDRRYHKSQTGDKRTYIKPGEKVKIAIWNSFKRQVLLEKRKIENLPPAVKHFLHSDQTFTPENYSELAAIADVFNQFDAGDFLDYKSKVTFETTDLAILRESLENYLKEKRKRQKAAEDRERIKTKLYGLKDLYTRYKKFLKWSASEKSNISLARSTDYAHGIFGDDEINEHLAAREQNILDKRAELTEALKQNGFDSMAEFQMYIDEYEQAFEKETVAIANNHLTRYRHVLFEEEKKLEDDQYLTNLFNEISALAKPIHQQTAKNYEAIKQLDSFDQEKLSSTDLATIQEMGNEAQGNMDKVAAAIPDLPSARQNAIIQESEPTTRALINAKNKEAIKSILKKYIKDQRESIDETWEDINGHPDRIYELDKLVGASMKAQGIVPDSNTIFEAIIKDKAEEIANQKMLKAIVFTIIGIALAIGTLGTGTPAIIAGIASLGLSGLAVYEAIEEYKSDSAAHDVGLLSDDPSLVWVVVAIVGAGLDVAAVSAAFKSAKLLKAVDAFNDSAKAADDLAKLNTELAKINEVSEAIRNNIAREAEEHTKGMNMLRSIVQTDGVLRSTIVPGGEEFVRLVIAAYHFAKKGVIEFDVFLKQLKAAKYIDDIASLTAEQKVKLKDVFRKGLLLNRSKTLQDQVARLLQMPNLGEAEKFRAIDMITEGLTNVKLVDDDIIGIISKITRSGGDTSQVTLNTKQALSELSNALRVTGEASGTVKINAVKGITYDLGNGIKTKIDPMIEIDTLFAKGSTVNAHEVKYTANALIEKVRKSDQLKRMLTWRRGQQNRIIEIVIESEQGWTKIFSEVNGEELIAILARDNVPLKIGNIKFSPQKLLELNKKMTAYYKKLGNPKPKDFFSRPELQYLSSTFQAIGFKL